MSWLVALAAIVCLPRVASPARPPAPNVAGTYRFQICAKKCALGDTDTAGFVGTLVLDSAALAFPFAEDTVRHVLPFAVLWNDGIGTMNACFVQRWGIGSGEPMAGIHTAARMEWSAVRDSALGNAITFSTFRTWDAGFDVVAAIKGDLLEGRGVVWDMTSSQHRPSGYFIARRIGPPNQQPCFDAGRAKLAREAALAASGASSDSFRHAVPAPAAAVFRAVADVLIAEHFVIADSSAEGGRIITQTVTRAPRDAVAKRGLRVTVTVRASGDSALVRLVVESRLRVGLHAGPYPASVTFPFMEDLEKRLGLWKGPFIDRRVTGARTAAAHGHP